MKREERDRVMDNGERLVGTSFEDKNEIEIERWR